MNIRHIFIILLAFLALLLLACDLTLLTGGAMKPTVTITAPPNGMRVDTGAQVAVQATATDARGIAWIELWVDGAIAGNQVLPAPQTSYTAVLPWRATTPGAHIVQVRAYNTGGAASDPAVISIEVAPVVAQATQLPPPPPSPTRSLAPPSPVPPTPPTSPSLRTPTPTAFGGPSPLPTILVQVIRPVTPFPPADLPFHIDCSAIDPSKKAACDTYIANTRDLAYPLLRELTGTSLSSCYDAVYYKILLDNPRQGAVGIADRNKISYSQAASVDYTPIYDAHELLHTFAFCSGALDDHIFHSFDNYVYLRLTGRERYGADTMRSGAAQLMGYNLQFIKNDSDPAKRAEQCRGYLGNLMTVLYYDSGIETIKRLYRATIKPGPAATPNQTIASLFGTKGNQFQALVNALKRDAQYPLNVPECGY